jgi:uncharacterized phosphosugar-binding protein
MTSETPTAAAYLTDLTLRVGRLFYTNEQAIAAASDAVERTAKGDGLVYVLGTGHSHTLAEEAHYRAGGLAFTVPILASEIMVHDGAVAGTVFERTPGGIAPILARYPIGPRDILIIASNSGVNAAIVEAAEIGRAAGATLIALTSLAYSHAAAQGRKRLADLADIVLDNGAPPGDATVTLPDSDLRAGPISTSVGAALLNAVFVEVAARLQAGGEAAPIYRSANMPGANEANSELIARYAPRNPHL